MRIKSYFASTVEEAMAQAHAELGPEAMLVNSRRSSMETRHLGEYEVIIVTEASESQLEHSQAASPPLGVSVRAPAPDRLSVEVAELKKELEGMRRAIARTAVPVGQWRGGSPDLSDAYAALTASELAPELAREILEAAEARIGGPSQAPGRNPARLDRSALERALREELESRIRVEPSLGRNESRPRIAALVGPPGAGKTTTLVKLAVNYGLACRRPVMLLSVDTYRIAAAEQLRSFATILGVGFQVLETVGALAQAIEEHRSKELLLIDTPGIAAGDFAEFAPLAQFLSTRTDIDTHVVVSASMKSADLYRVIDGFELFQPRRIIFTKLDETTSFGPILSEAVRTGKPLSFFTTGQRIPEDMENAARGRLASLILGGEFSQMAPAA